MKQRNTASLTLISHLFNYSALLLMCKCFSLLMNALWSTIFIQINKENKDTFSHLCVCVCVYDSAALSISNHFFQTLHPGDIHGPSATSGPGFVPSLRVSRLAHDASLRHPAQAVGTRRHCPRRRPAPRALAAVRPSDLLHQQPVSHAGLLRNHRPAGGLCFHRIRWIFISVLRICSTALTLIFWEA